MTEPRTERDGDEGLSTPLVDSRRAVYDTTATAKPFLALRETVTEFLSAVLETVDRDPAPVIEPLKRETAWWMRVGTQEYLAGVHLATTDSPIVSLDIDYDFESEERLSIPGPDALPLVADDEQLRVTLVFDEGRPVTPDVALPEPESESVTFDASTVERVSPDDRQKAETTPVGDEVPHATGPPDQQERPDHGPGGDGGNRSGVNGGDQPGRADESDGVTVTAIGPAGQEHAIDLAPDEKIGVLVATLVRESDGATAITLSRDGAGRETVDSDTPATEFDGQQLYWQPIDRSGGGV